MEAIDRVVISLDWITGLFLLSLLLLVFAKEMFYPRFLNFIILPFNNRYVVLYNKKGRLFSGFHLALSLFQMLNLALFVYLGVRGMLTEINIDDAFLFPAILAGVLVFTLLKVGLEWIGGYIFGKEKLFVSALFNKLSYLNYSSLALFGANLLLTYLVPGSIPLIGLAAFLFLLINSIGWISLLKLNQNVITSHLFYFILYLCALEIAPFLIISNLVKA